MANVSKPSLLALATILFIGVGFGQTGNKPVENHAAKSKNSGEKTQQYWFVLLKAGPNKNLDSATMGKIFEGHMANMNKLYKDGILKVAGPFGKNDFEWRGIFIFDCKTKEEAEKIAASDPGVATGLFAVDIIPWYCEPTGSFKHGKPEKSTDDVNN